MPSRPDGRERQPMAFDVFTFRDRVVDDYADYFRSFVNIDDPDIAHFVHPVGSLAGRAKAGCARVPGYGRT